MPIRSASREDVDAWLKLRQRLRPGCPPEQHRSEAEAILGSDRAAAFMARSEGGDPQGFIEVSLRAAAEGCGAGPIGYLEGWYVLPPFRSLGVGRGLMEAAERWAAEKGAREMASGAETANTASQAAHEEFGYQKVAVLVHYRKSLSAGQ